uniref:Uncharacterized protein n=1 Tax=Entomoneis paludosa TaxID=265537 RepID=A0A7S2VHH5_9STRA
MVRFSRFRTRSRSIASARQSNSDDEETSTPLFPRARSSTKTSFIDLKRLQSKERKLTDEDIELRDLLKKINANVDGDDETDLTTTVGLLKQRTSSTTSSSQGNGDRNSRESLAQESLLTKKQPLWKRRLSRVTLGTGQSQKQKRAAKKQAEIEKQSLERNQDGEDRQGVSLIEANEDKMVQKRIQSKDFSIGKRQSSKLDTVDDEEDDIAGPIGMPSGT